MPRTSSAWTRSELLEVPEKIALTATGPHALLAGVKTLELETDYEARGLVAAHAVRQFRAHAGTHRRRRRRAVRAARGRRARAAERRRFAVHQSRAGQCRQCAAVRQHRQRAHVARTAWCCSTTCARDFRPVTIPRASIDDPRLYKTMFIVLGLWLVWVLGSTRLRAPAIERARSVRGRARAARRRLDRAHRRAVAHGAAPVRSVFRAAWRAPRAAPAATRPNAATSGSGSSATAPSCRRNSIS